MVSLVFAAKWSEPVTEGERQDRSDQDNYRFKDNEVTGRGEENAKHETGIIQDEIVEGDLKLKAL